MAGSSSFLVASSSSLSRSRLKTPAWKDWLCRAREKQNKLSLVNAYGSMYIYTYMYVCIYILYTEYKCICVIIESPTKHPHPKNVLHIASRLRPGSPLRLKGPSQHLLRWLLVLHSGIFDPVNSHVKCRCFRTKRRKTANGIQMLLWKSRIKWKYMAKSSLRQSTKENGSWTNRFYNTKLSQNPGIPNSSKSFLESDGKLGSVWESPTSQKAQQNESGPRSLLFAIAQNASSIRTSAGQMP